MIDKSQPYMQITATEMSTNADGVPVVATGAVQYDYHSEHTPKLTKQEPEDPPESEPTE
jgi:hypothetical protein